MNSNNNFDEMLKRMGGSLNTNPQSLENAAKNGTLGDILKGFDKKKLDKLQKVLSNREETERILNSPQARELMKRLKKDKGAD
ncbi:MULTISPECIES: hypothetical protein [unclassified Ruminococcus]|uniref:hypothetical protein n=1 Tax=unclassified Ruminococcus TaxID=2608920 RepID=UPI00210CFFD2|nr:MULTISPECIES: hypothetical protein [unclassified Ruminococcus]MCQ4023026.1 hypothetical protein [Ruminococcus sp. zg-924]MCQ4115463.1 hypothetical protein [Ruminococcus sp. zg-921]